MPQRPPDFDDPPKTPGRSPYSESSFSPHCDPLHIDTDGMDYHSPFDCTPAENVRFFPFFFLSLQYNKIRETFR